MVLLPLLIFWLRDPMYFNAPSRWAIVLLALVAGLLAPQTLSVPPLSSLSIAVGAEREPLPQGQEDRAATYRQSLPTQALLREGTRLAPRVGRFSQVDGGWMFQAESSELDASTQPAEASAKGGTENSHGYQLRVLENLTLQRVAQTIQQDLADDRWLVSGIVTEYFGENRLIITAAMRATAPAEPNH